MVRRSPVHEFGGVESRTAPCCTDASPGIALDPPTWTRISTADSTEQDKPGRPLAITGMRDFPERLYFRKHGFHLLTLLGQRIP